MRLDFGRRYVLHQSEKGRQSQTSQSELFIERGPALIYAVGEILLYCRPSAGLSFFNDKTKRKEQIVCKCEHTRMEHGVRSSPWSLLVIGGAER